MNKLIDKLQQEIILLEKIEFSELKEKLDIITEEYGDDVNITLNVVNIKPSLKILAELREEMINLKNKNNYLETKLNTIQNYLKSEDMSDDIFNIEFPLF